MRIGPLYGNTYNFVMKKKIKKTSEKRHMTVEPKFISYNIQFFIIF